jgi:hypothetical protein
MRLRLEPPADADERGEGNAGGPAGHGYELMEQGGGGLKAVPRSSTARLSGLLTACRLAFAHPPGLEGRPSGDMGKCAQGLVY